MQKNVESILVDNILTVKYNQDMRKRQEPITVTEAGKRGGKARAKKYPRQQLQEWARLGGWPKGRPRKPRSTKSLLGGKQ